MDQLFIAPPKKKKKIKSWIHPWAYPPSENPIVDKPSAAGQPTQLFIFLQSINE